MKMLKELHVLSDYFLFLMYLSCAHHEGQISGRRKLLFLDPFKQMLAQSSIYKGQIQNRLGLGSELDTLSWIPPLVLQMLICSDLFQSKFDFIYIFAGHN